MRPRISSNLSFGVPRESSVSASKAEVAVPQWNHGRANEWARHRNVTLISFCKLWERVGGGILSELAREYDEREAEREVDVARAVLKKIEADELVKLAANRTPRVELVMAAVCLLLGKRGEWGQSRRLLKNPTFVEDLEKTDVSLSEFIQLQRTKDKADVLKDSFPAELRKLGYLRRVHDWKANTPAGAVQNTPAGAVQGTGRSVTFA